MTEYAILGDRQVSRLCFGTLTMGPLQANLPVEVGAELICHASARGINFLDTAEYYETYPYVREALRRKAELVICTKSYAYDLEGAKRSVEKAQREMDREYLDIFLMHEQESYHTLRGHEEAFNYYKRMQQDGIIGKVGISTHHIAAVQAAAKWPGMDVIFPLINRRGLGIADGTRKEMEDAIRIAHDAGIFILGMKALGGGHMIEDREAAFSYIRSLNTVDAVAVGMQSKAEIDYNIALFSGKKPAEEDAQNSIRANRRLLVEDWCEGCGRCVQRCGQHALTVIDGHAVPDDTKCVRCGYCAAVCPQFCIKVI